MEISQKLNKGFQVLGFDQEKNDCLFLCQDIDSIDDLELRIHLEKANLFNANAVFFTKELDRFKPQVYLYDFTNELFNENDLTNIQKKVWSNGSVPIVCAFYDTEIKILDCTQHIKKDNTPVYLANLEIVARAHQLYNDEFAVKIKTGAFWEEIENKNKFKFNSSAYDILIEWIKEIIRQSPSFKDVSQNKIVKKVIIQSIMIKYLEERKDKKGNSPFNKKYVKKYDNAKDFVDVLEKNKLVDLLEDLQRDLNGNLFEWSTAEKEVIKLIDLSSLSEALKAYKKPEEINNNIFELIRFYEFSYIPVELISRIYEEFLAGDTDINLNQKNKKQKEGIFYTPSHLAQLLVDESMPLKTYKKVNLSTYKILDPACGSGIFLVLAYKRLVQWWRLQNDFALPKPKDLKKLLTCIYGVDKEEQATKLTAFSLCLALCDTLSPMQIISDLKFIDLTENNILYSDFFIDEIESPKDDSITFDHYKKQKLNFSKLREIKFSTIIGNPPFDRGAINNYSKLWKKENVKIPQGQIALKFLSESLPLLAENGILCLIIKSSSLLYNSTSKDYREVLFTNYNVSQVFDFTPLARNKSLWDNGADVATAAIFIENRKPDFRKNILHLLFRRTKAVKERINFEVDDYDFNFINRNEAITNPYIWKINLLGGGRISTLINKSKQLDTFQNFVDDNGCEINEGFIVGNNGQLHPDFMYKMRTLPTGTGISENGIDYEKLIPLDDNTKFLKVPSKYTFEAPNLILWENIGVDKLPVFLNNRESFSFRDKLIGLKSDSLDLMKSIKNNFDLNSDFYRFYMFCVSSQLLINKNTAILKKDYMNLRYIDDRNIFLSALDKKIISDVNNYFQFFLRNGEKSKAVQRISNNDFKDVFINFGNEFSKILNLLYQENNNKFRLSQVDKILGGAYLVSVFKYDNQNKDIKYTSDETNSIQALTEFEITKHLSSKRIIRLYNTKDTIIIIKPNQYRYWLSLSAYRDADKSIIDLTKMGY